MRRRYLVGNWKMNLPAEGLDSYLQHLARPDRTDVELLIAPPYPFLVPVLSRLTVQGLKASVAAQNCSDLEAGASTGEVSARMLAGLGIRSVILGHSERRARFRETDDLVGRKLVAASMAGLTPILCVGEDDAAHKRGETNQMIQRQIEVGLKEFPRSKPLVIAYEPVWAIGTGQNATPTIASAAHSFIRGCLVEGGFDGDHSILYGGSVSADNAEELAAEGEIDGFLVGGASLEAPKFRMIYERMIRGRAHGWRGH